MFNAILELTKYRLSLSVIFSSVAGYLIAIDYFSIETFLLLCFGGFFLVGASNGFNQIIERDRDSTWKNKSKISFYYLFNYDFIRYSLIISYKF